jgi:transketolase
MVGVAAGLATCGFIPVVVCFAAFLTRRCFDQIYNSVCFPGLNVKLVGAYCGFTTTGTGASHQTFDDIALITTLPNIIVLNVGDAQEAQDAMSEAVAVEGPVYVRVPRIDHAPPIYAHNDHFRIGSVPEIERGKDGAVLSTGIMTGTCRKVVKRLHNEGISLSLFHVPTLKPVCAHALTEVLRKYKVVFTVEDHRTTGGLGGQVYKLAMMHRTNTVVSTIGIDDRFGKCGSLEDLYVHFGLSEDDIHARIKHELLLKE